jgi:glutaminase
MSAMRCGGVSAASLRATRSIPSSSWNENGIPRNPFINAGAIVVADILLEGHQPKEAIGEVLRFTQFLADDDTIYIDRAVAASEKVTGFRNFALANYMRAFGNLKHAPELTLGVYFHLCAIEMSCLQLARAGRFLAHDGRIPGTGHRGLAQRARRINALMLTCGHYDGSGDFAFKRRHSRQERRRGRHPRYCAGCCVTCRLVARP